MLKEDTMLYHYTSPDAMKNIIESKRIHLTNINFLADKFEMQYPYKVLQEALESSDCQDILRKNIEKVIQNKTNYISIISYAKSLYVASFTKASDDLFMWNSYTNTLNKHGYSIGFHANEFVSKDFGAPYGFWGSRFVMYDVNEQMQSFKEVIAKYDELTITDKNIVEIMQDFSYSITYLAIFMKHPKFSYEQEYRLIFEPNITVKLKGFLKDPKYTLDFKVKNGILVPYFSFPFNIKAIKEITLSPYMDFCEAKQGLSHYLSYINEKIEVKQPDLYFN